MCRLSLTQHLAPTPQEACSGIVRPHEACAASVTGLAPLGALVLLYIETLLPSSLTSRGSGNLRVPAAFACIQQTVPFQSHYSSTLVCRLAPAHDQGVPVPQAELHRASQANRGMPVHTQAISK